MNNNKSFLDYVKSAYPLLLVKSSEQERVLTTMVKDLQATSCGTVDGNKVFYKSLSWGHVAGTRTLAVNSRGRYVVGGEAIPYTLTKMQDGVQVEQKAPSESDPLAPLVYLDKEAENGTVMFLKDYHHYLQTSYPEYPFLLSYIRDLCGRLVAQQKCIVFVSPSFKIPEELEKDCSVVDFTLPDKDTLKAILQSICGPNAGTMPTGAKLDAVLDAAAGMTSNEACNAFSLSLVTAKKIDAAVVRKEKAQVIRKSGVLEIIESAETMDDIGGLENLKEWINIRKNSFGADARDFGVTPTKGVLLLGVPGCGKSLTAKAAASGLQRPLVRLEMGKIFGSYVGESENNMAAVLKVLAGIAPCVLWIDEIEKGLSGNKAGSEGHETTRRVFQMLLTWMSEKQEDVLLVATANSIDSLPPELTRPGRIDAIFYVDLPDDVQRTEIFKIHLKKSKGSRFPNGRNPEMFNDHLPELMTICDHWTGAEIEVWIKEALLKAYYLGHADIQIEDLREASKEITPIYRLQSAQIMADREKATRNGMKNASRVRNPEVVSGQEQAERRVNTSE